MENQNTLTQKEVQALEADGWEFVTNGNAGTWEELKASHDADKEFEYRRNNKALPTDGIADSCFVHLQSLWRKKKKGQLS